MMGAALVTTVDPAEAYLRKRHVEPRAVESERQLTSAWIAGLEAEVARLRQKN